MGFSLSDIAFSHTFEWSYGTLIVCLSIFAICVWVFARAVMQLINRYFKLSNICDQKDRRIQDLEREVASLKSDNRKNQ